MAKYRKMGGQGLHTVVNVRVQRHGTPGESLDPVAVARENFLRAHNSLRLAIFDIVERKSAANWAEAWAQALELTENEKYLYDFESHLETLKTALQKDWRRWTDYLS